MKSKVYESFLHMEQAAYADGALPKKTKELIAIGVAGHASLRRLCLSCDVNRGENMPKQDREALRDKSLVLVFIAASVREAERAKAALTSAGIDYCLDRVNVASRKQGCGASMETGVRLAHNLGEESDMTEALVEVFKEASKLSDAEQDALAEAIRAELGTEKDRDRSFASSLDILERLADEAIADHRAGRITPIDPDKM